MEEIKFRAWDKIHKDVKEVAAISWIENMVVLWSNTKNARVTIFRDLDQVDIMQYTGRKDKNGKEIYEGDVVDVIFYNYLRGVGIVKFDNSYGQWGVHMPKDNYIDNLYEWVEYGCKVIGNIYENPNLLEVL